MKKFGLLAVVVVILIIACDEKPSVSLSSKSYMPDTLAIPNDTFGNLVRYGRELMLHTAYYIGPEGINGQYLGNKMNCTNCHQDAGTKPFSFNLMRAHERYPQYRPREDRVLTIIDRINNCVMRPHSGKPLPHNSLEMLALQSYLKWINSYVSRIDSFAGEKNLQLTYPERAANPQEGERLYIQYCQRCHGADGAGLMQADSVTYVYPPLWGPHSYQPGSSMHRVTMQARWLKANMPHDQATWEKPVLSDEEALDIAAFVNDDRIHQRPHPETFDYPNTLTKPMDYGMGPYADTFPELQHKFGPYPPIILYWESKKQKLVR